jgi:hypothetical protein
MAISPPTIYKKDFNNGFNSLIYLFPLLPFGIINIDLNLKIALANVRKKY